MVKDLLKKVVVGGMIVGAGLGLSGCYRNHTIDGNLVKENLSHNGLVEYKDGHKIKYITKYRRCDPSAIVVDGHRYTKRDGEIFEIGAARYYYLKDGIQTNKNIERKEKGRRVRERDKETVERDMRILKW